MRPKGWKSIALHTESDRDLDFIGTVVGGGCVVVVVGGGGSG